METAQASLRANSQTTCRATAMPSTQKGAEPRATMKSWPWPASPIASATATNNPPPMLTIVGCRRAIERSAATLTRIKGVVSLGTHTSPPGLPLHWVGAESRPRGAQHLDLRALRDDRLLQVGRRGHESALDLDRGGRRALLPLLPARDGGRSGPRRGRRGRSLAGAPAASLEGADRVRDQARPRAGRQRDRQGLPHLDLLRSQGAGTPWNGARRPGLDIALSTPETRYAKSGDASIAYQVVGDGPIDLVLVLGFTTHLELQWESPPQARFFERLASFSRLIIFDKRGSGLSDPVTEAPTLEVRIDDVRAVMDAAGSERAALFGVSEGGPMSILFAATHPERVSALVLHGAMGRTTEAPDYPWASPAEALRESAAEFIAPYWGQDPEGMLELFSPSLAGNPQAAEFTARFERSSASPAMVQQIFEMFLDIDVRAVLPTIHVPTLVIHRRGDRVVNWRAGKELAAQIPDARYVELPGIDHIPWAGDQDAVLGE